MTELYQVESKGWVEPDDPNEWLPCYSESMELAKAVERLTRLVNDDRDKGVRYPYRIVPVNDKVVR